MVATFTTLSIAELVFLAIGFGVIVGSFLNVVIYRLHTGRSLNGHSHCLTCGTALRPYDLFPVVSYLWLRGRCRVCGCRFSARYVLVEAMTGFLFVAAVFSAASWYQLLLLWFLLAVLVVIFVYDVRHFIIPDELTVLVLCAVLLLQLPPIVQAEAWQLLAFDILAAFFGSLFLFLLWFVSKGTWIGFGDVKLAFPLGLLAGYTSVFSMIVLSFWVGAAISICLVALGRLQRGKIDLPFVPAGLTIKSVVPFAPFLIIGSLSVLFLHINVLSFFSF